MCEIMCNVFRRSWPGYTSMALVGFEPQSRYFNGKRLPFLILHACRVHGGYVTSKMR